MNFLYSSPNTSVGISFSEYGRFSLIGTIVTILIIGFLVVYYYRRKYSEPDYLLKTDEYTTTNVTTANTYMLTPSEVGKFIKNNFTLSFFLFVESVNSSLTGDVVLVNLGGFGEIVLNKTTNKLALKVNTTNPTNYQAISSTRIDISDFTEANWVQIAIVNEGATVKIYRNGVFVNSSILSNVPVSKPLSVEYVKQVDAPFKISFVHAYGRVLSGSEINADYKSILPAGSTVPIASSYSSTLKMNDLTQTFKRIMESIGIKPVSEDELRLGPTQYINYEYA
jgi:hypothetical protein